MSQAFAHAPFFALRTPLLSFNELLEWQAAVMYPGADAEGYAEGRARAVGFLFDIMKRPEVAEAILIASPVTYERALAPEASSRGKATRLELTLARYFSRMAGRPTPFGEFAGCSTGTFGSESRLELPARAQYIRRCRIDFEYVSEIVSHLEALPAVTAEIKYRPNTSLYKAAGRWRYAEAEKRQAIRVYRLVSVEPSPYLDAVLDRATGLASIRELVETLLAADPTLAESEAMEYVQELIAAQLLISALTPPVTGLDCVGTLLDRLQVVRQSIPLIGQLHDIRQLTKEFEDTRLGEGVHTLNTIRRKGSELAIQPNEGRFLQVDLYKLCSPTVSTSVGADILQAVGVLRRFQLPRDDGLAAFQRAFEDRYGTATVPLVVALDEESGIGFRNSAAPESADVEILQGIPMPARATTEHVHWAARERVLLEQLQRAWSGRHYQMTLSDADLSPLGGEHVPDLPDAFGAVCSLMDGPDGLRLVLRGVHGPSGARMLGRFCDHDAELLRGVREHLRNEERQSPDAVFAEIVHVPQARLGNVQARPHLRAYEIEYLGVAGGGVHVLPIDDLLVSLNAGRIELRSRSLQREIVPRMTTAYNLTTGPAVYQFLAALQSQDVLGWGMWSWTPFQGAAFLPRVVYKSAVLSRAQWLWSASVIKSLTALTPEAAFAATQKWRQENNVPRWILLQEADNEMPVDLDNILSVEMLVDLAAGKSQVVLVELLPSPDRLCCSGPEGAYTHELLVPFERIAARSEVRTDHKVNAVVERPWVPAFDDRLFTPGGEWLYLKIYTSYWGADLLIDKVVKPLAARLLDSGAADRWFFVRYADPEWHLRVRFHGSGESLTSAGLTQVRTLLSNAVYEQIASRLEVGSYQREIERYGGPSAISHAEAIFQADSEAAIEIVRDVQSPDRWLACLAAFHGMLVSMGFGPDECLALLDTGRQGTHQPGVRSKDIRIALGDRYRAAKGEIDKVLKGQNLSPAVASALQRRAATIREAFALITQHLTSGTPGSIALSLLHMTANRLFRSNAGMQEFVLYDMLFRYHSSNKSRTARRESPAAS